MTVKKKKDLTTYAQPTRIGLDWLYKLFRRILLRTV